MGKKIEDGKYKIAKKAPAYLDGLNTFLDEGKTTNDRMKNKAFIDNVKSTWPDFYRKYGRIAPVKTPEEKQEAKKQRVEAFLEKNKAAFEAVSKSGLAGGRLKEVAHRIAIAGNKKQKGNDGNPNKRRRDEDQEEDGEEGDEAEDEAEDEEEVEQDEEEEDVEEEEEGMEQDEDQKEEEEYEEQEEEEHESEPKKPASPKKEKIIMEALSPNRRKERKEGIQKALQKKVPVKSLESMKTNFYSLLTQYGIGADEKVAELFERVYDISLEQNRALGSVETLIKDILD